MSAYVHLHDEKNKWIGYANTETGELFTLAGNSANPLTYARNGTVRRSKNYAKLREAANRINIQQNHANRHWEASTLASAPRSKEERQAALRSLLAPASEALDEEATTSLKEQLQSILK